MECYCKFVENKVEVIPVSGDNLSSDMNDEKVSFSEEDAYIHSAIDGAKERVNSFDEALRGIGNNISYSFFLNYMYMPLAYIYFNLLEKNVLR